MDIINLGTKPADHLHPGDHIITDNRVAQVVHVSQNTYGQTVIRSITHPGQDTPEVRIVAPGTLYRTVKAANTERHTGETPRRRNGLAWNEEPFALPGSGV